MSTLHYIDEKIAFEILVRLKWTLMDFYYPITKLETNIEQQIDKQNHVF